MDGQVHARIDSQAKVGAARLLQQNAAAKRRRSAGTLPPAAAAAAQRARPTDGCGFACLRRPAPSWIPPPPARRTQVLYARHADVRSATFKEVGGR